MSNVKKCLICGAEFRPRAATQKYCSDVCRAAGAKMTRAKWIQNTGYREKDRERKKRQADRDREERREQAELSAQQREDEGRTRADQRRRELEEKAAAGDALSLMMLAKREGDAFEYWTQYARYEKEYSESQGKRSTRKVNGISVYDDLFAEKVLAIADEIGVIVTRL